MQDYCIFSAVRNINLSTHILGLLMLLFLNSPLNGGEVWGIKFPAPSPDGKRISFSCYGDIWVVDADGGKTERLTVSEGYESRSFWSPDGKWIAFETDRWGNDDVCIIPSDGSSPPKRLTYYSTYDILYGWTPDGDYVLFGSWRKTLRRSLYRVSVKGGLPEMIANFTAREVCFLPQGERFFYVRGGAPWWRRRYKGGADQDIWVKTLPNGKSRRITDSPGRDGYPMYSQMDKKLYFLSNRGEGNVNNIWRMDLEGESPEQITYEKEDVHFPEISWDGSLIAYECFGYIYTYNVLSDEKKKLNITISEDYKENPFLFRKFTKDASEFSLSPDEKKLAFVVHGDIFVMELKEDNEPGKIAKLTDTPYLEKHISWHPEKEMLIYSSMEDGDMDIYTIEPRDEEKLYDDLLFEKRKILETEETEIKPLFSPDGEKIAYFKNKRELYVMNKGGKKSRKLCPENDVLWIDWSPDSKWITFSRTTLGWREDIFIVPADGSKEPVNISNHPNDDYKPMWSADGRRIAFASRDPMENLWMKYVFLLEEDEERDKEYWEKMESDTYTVKEELTVNIDFEDIEDRVHIVTKVLGEYNYVAQSPDGKQFAIYSHNQDSHDIWTVDWLGKELKRVTKNDVHPKQFFVSKDKKKIFYLTEEGRIFNADIASTQSSPLGFNVEIGIDRNEEMEQVFNEAWWALKDGFYDSDFHGVDWRAMYDKYKDLALRMRTTRGLHSVIAMMIGELNASHLGIWKSDGVRETTGTLGIIYDTAHRRDGIRIKDIIPDSPVSEKKVGIHKGDIITHINGKKIKQGENYYAFLRNKNNKDVMLTVLEKGKKRNVKVKLKDPRSIWDLVDKNWIKSNKEYVKERSNNRVGYLYIASMGGENLRKFEKDLYKEMDKEALIIDIRYNGGGRIHDELLNILRRTAYAYSIERGGKKEYSSLFRWDKSTVVLINEYCYSDAEIFPAAFKELKIGTLVGVPTYGAVIGTNNIELLEGSTFRVPGTGWYLLTGENLENTPVEPDIYVENSPEEDDSSSDHQLTKAIDVLMEETGR